MVGQPSRENLIYDFFSGPRLHINPIPLPLPSTPVFFFFFSSFLMALEFVGVPAT